MMMNRKTPNHGLLALAGWVLLCFAAASMGGLFMPGDWYAALKKPSWNPQGWIFGPVWTALYIMMAVAAWLVWKQGGFKVQGRALTMFLVQLGLNAAWTPLFFGLHWIGMAFAEIVLLWLAIAATVAVFRPVSHPATLLLVPLPCLGQLRRSVEFHDLAIEHLNT